MTNPANPFGNSLQFIEVNYLDQLNQVPPPFLQVSAFMPAPTTITADGLTLELWFKALSSGSLVSVPMSNGQATAIAPLIYIDTNGVLRAGLFDSTQITLYSGQNLIAQNNDGLINVGALNTLKSPLAVVDGEWHHCALVVEPDANGTQSLFLDGRLAASGTANGSFALSFVASDGTTWTAETPAATMFGGSITPQPVVSSGPFQPYAQGFCGCVNELRTWYGPRSATGIQQLMDEPLALNFNFYQQQEGLAGYVGAGVFSVIQTSAYLVTTPDAPPVDPFTDVTSRVPGFQNYGICTAIPFTTVALEVAFQPSQTYSTKISLCRNDQLQVSFPTTDVNGDDLSGTFSMTLTGGVTGQIQTINQIAHSTPFVITAPLTDCYRFDFTYSETATIDNLQFMLIPGPINTFMQLILDVLPSQTAYTDPNYPITPTTLPDPRPQYAGKSVTLSPYWPLFTDQTAFPIASSATYNAGDLLSSYLNFNAAAQQLSPGTSFTDFFNLGNSTIDDPTALTNLLQQAYFQVTGQSAPIIPPQANFASADDQIYAFIYNVNTMRTTLGAFLNAYQGWAGTIIDDLSLAAIPSTAANEIYNGQSNLQTNLNGPSIGNFIGSLLVSSAIVGLGAVLGPLLLPAEIAATVSATTITFGAIGGGGANVASELIGTFWNSSTGQSKPQLQPVSYSTLAEVVQNVSTATTNAYLGILEILLDPQYTRILYSNYGLLQALSFVNAQPLSNVNQNSMQGVNNSLFTGTTYVSWKALIPAVFKWSPQTLTGTQLENNVVFQVTTTGDPLFLPYKSYPARLGIQEVLQSDPWMAFYWMLHQLQSWQTGTESRTGQFFSVCPIFFYSVSTPGPGPVNPFNSTADWVIAWSLIDNNNNAIADTTATKLFGSGSPTSPLSLVDQNNPLQAVGYGWYCQIANAAVTTPFDAFMNWGEGIASYSPGILVASPAEFGNLYHAMDGPNQVLFAAAGATDTPPPAVNTLEPSTLSFGGVAIGSSSQLTAVLTNNPVVVHNVFTNNQQKDLQNISATSDSSAFVVTAPADVQAGQTGTVTVTFQPGASDTGLQTGTITINATGQYGSISLTLACSGTGVEAT